MKQPTTKNMAPVYSNSQLEQNFFQFKNYYEQVNQAINQSYQQQVKSYWKLSIIDNMPPTNKPGPRLQEVLPLTPIALLPCPLHEP